MADYRSQGPDPRHRQPSPEKRWERLVILAGAIGFVVLVALCLMIRAWGFAGFLWRVIGVAVVGGTGYLVWKRRKKIWRAMTATRPDTPSQTVVPSRPAGNSDAVVAALARNVESDAGASHKMTFLGPGTVLRGKRGKLADPLVYVISGGGSGIPEPSLMADGLPVASPGTACSAPLPYWPDYRAMTPSQRGVYQDWLFGGRKQLPPEIGYAFVFFYGLERRVLVDRADAQAVWDEVVRLRGLNAGPADANWSFESYTSNFLWFISLPFADSIDEPRVRQLAETTKAWNDDSLSAALSWFMNHEKPLPTYMAYVVARQQPGSQNSVVVTRVNEEFRKLFEARYRQAFGDGLVVRSSKRDRKYCYKTASEIFGTVECTTANPLGLASQFKELSGIWNACVDDLRRLSSTVQKQGDTALTPAAWEAMPPELRAGLEHPLTDPICRLVQECTDEQGRALIPVSRLATLFGLEERQRLTPTQSQRICQTVENVGYCIEPDFRLEGKAYRTDEVVTTFLSTTDDRTVPDRYRVAACFLRMGMVVAGADGQADPAELKAITAQVEQLFQLTDHEHRRLEALRMLLCAGGSDIRGMVGLSDALSPQQREAVAKLLLVLVAADGVVTKEEIRAVRKCYVSLGFSKDEVERALETLRGHGQEEPVTVKAGAAPAPGEAIPSAPGQETEVEEGFRLDRAAIAAIMVDTQEVARMLAEAMRGEGDTVVPDHLPAPVPAAPSGVGAVFIPPSAAAPASIPVAGPTSAAPEVGGPPLPQRYAAFYEVLISRNEWTLEEIGALARQQGLMLSGAIDALNEWAVEKYGGQLFVQDDARVFVEREYLS